MADLRKILVTVNDAPAQDASSTPRCSTSITSRIIEQATAAITTKSGGLPAILPRPLQVPAPGWTGEFGMLRVRTCVRSRSSAGCSLAGMSELQRMLDDIAENPGVVRHFVLSSTSPAYSTSAATWRCSCCWCAQDIDSLKMYGRRCIDLVWWMETAALRGVHTTVLVQGDTLGGGLESVLPFHKVVFERSAQAGFPRCCSTSFRAWAPGSSPSARPASRSPTT